MKRRLLALLVAGTLVVGQAPAAFAAEEYDAEFVTEEDEFAAEEDEFADELSDFCADDSLIDAVADESFTDDDLYEEESFTEESFFAADEEADYFEYGEEVEIELSEEGEAEYSDGLDTQFGGTEEYYDRPEGGDYLLGWGDTIDRRFAAYIKNADYPEGYHFECEIISVVPQSNCSGIIELEEEDYGWFFRTVGVGTATLAVTYKDEWDKETTYNLVIDVVDDIYECRIKAEDNRTNLLPGDSIALFAEVEHKVILDSEEEQKDTSSVTCKWAVIQGQAFATVRETGNGEAQLTIADSAKDLENNEVKVQAVFSENGKEVGSTETRLFVHDSYYDLYPFELDPEFALGSTITIEPELRYYPGKSSAYDVVGKKDTRVLFGYNTEELEIRDEKGIIVPDDSSTDFENVMGTAPQKFTIKRLGRGDIHLTIEMDYLDENGEWQRGEDRQYWFDNIEIGDIQFEQHDYEVFVGKTVNIRLEGADFLKNSGLSAKWTCGEWEKTYDEEDNGIWHKTTEKGWSYKDGVVTVDTQNILDQGIEDFRILIEIFDGNERLGRADTWVHIRKNEEHYDIEWWNESKFLIGWDNFISKQGTAYIENAEHPEGTNVPYTITNIKIADSTPWEEGKEVFTLEEVEDGWLLKAVSHGDMNLEAAYTDINGKAKTTSLILRCCEEFWELRLLEDAPDNRVLPGQTFNLYAVLQYFGDNAEGRKLTYKWSVTEGAEAFSVEADPSDPSKAKVTVRKEAKEGVYGAITLTVYDEENNAVADEWIDYNVNNNYCGIIPNNFDSSFQYVGDVTTLDLKVLRGFVDDDGQSKQQTLQNKVFKFSYNPEIVKITDSNGAVVEQDQPYTGPFTVERLKNEEDRIQVIASDKDRPDDETARRVYFLNSADRNEAVKHVRELISALPEKPVVTDKEAVGKAKKCYDSLPEEDKEWVGAESVAKLNKAVAGIEQAEKDKEAADVVTGRINALPANPGVADEKTVNDVVSAYDGLLAEQKQYVPASALTKLTNAKNSVDAAKKKAEDDAKKKAEEDAKKKAEEDAKKKEEEVKKNATITPSATTVKKGKKATVKITADSKAKLTVAANNKNAKNKKFVSKIKNGATAKITFTKNAKKGAYKFKVTSAASGNYKETTKVITIKVK